MYCAKLTLIDRRHNNTTVRAKSKHATGFKRNCLMKEWGGCGGTGASPSRTIILGSLRNRYATHADADDDQQGDDDGILDSGSDASRSWWSRERDCEETRGRITTRLIFVFKFVSRSALIRAFNYVTKYYLGNLKIKATGPPRRFVGVYLPSQLMCMPFLLSGNQFHEINQKFMFVSIFNNNLLILA